MTRAIAPSATRSLVCISLLAGLLVACATTQEARQGAPPEGDATTSGAPTLSIAFGSCAHQDHPQPMLDVAIDQRPDAFVFLGDNVYADTGDPEELRAIYGRLEARPEFQRLKAAMPLHATWDDHDYGLNDGGREYEHKAVTAEVFFDFWGVPKGSDRRASPGVYGVAWLTSGERRVQLLLLDTRTFRGPLTPAGDDPRYKHRYRPDPRDDADILGAEQWAWLEARLQEPADLRVIATSIQFSADYTGFEAWANLPAEQTRMVHLLRKTGAHPVVFISGDVHHGELSKFSVEGEPHLYDLTSSGINKVGSILETNGARIGPAFLEENIGLLTVDWDTGSVRLALLGSEGRLLLEHRLSLDAMKP